MTRDWYPVPQNHKKVCLCNAENFKEVSEHSVSMALMGSGLREWETYLAGIFANAVQTSDNGVADVTKMFSCDLCGVDSVGTYCKKQAEVKAFLLEKLFNIVEENEEQLILEVKPEVLN